jgi:chromosome segregation ATPase
MKWYDDILAHVSQFFGLSGATESEIHAHLTENTTTLADMKAQIKTELASEFDKKFSDMQAQLDATIIENKALKHDLQTANLENGILKDNISTLVRKIEEMESMSTQPHTTTATDAGAASDSTKDIWMDNPINQRTRRRT